MARPAVSRGVIGAVRPLALVDSVADKNALTGNSPASQLSTRTLTALHRGCAAVYRSPTYRESRVTFIRSGHPALYPSRGAAACTPPPIFEIDEDPDAHALTSTVRHERRDTPLQKSQ